MLVFPAFWRAVSNVKKTNCKCQMFCNSEERVKPGLTIVFFCRPICIPCTKETSGALKLSGDNVKCKDHGELIKANVMVPK